MEKMIDYLSYQRSPSFHWTLVWAAGRDRILAPPSLFRGACWSVTAYTCNLCLWRTIGNGGNRLQQTTIDEQMVRRRQRSIKYKKQQLHFTRYLHKYVKWNFQANVWKKKFFFSISKVYFRQKVIPLTLSQTTNFRLFKTHRVCRR